MAEQIEKRSFDLAPNTKILYNFHTFTKLLEIYLSKPNKTTLFIVLDNLHRIKDRPFYHTLLGFLTNLSQIFLSQNQSISLSNSQVDSDQVNSNGQQENSSRNRINISLIMVSRIIWDKMRPNVYAREPILVHFPAWSGGLFFVLFTVCC